jgi:hypothetical protein
LEYNFPFIILFDFALSSILSACPNHPILCDLIKYLIVIPADPLAPERLRWRGPAATLSYRPVLSSERASHIIKTSNWLIVIQIWSSIWYQERLAVWPLEVVSFWRIHELVRGLLLYGRCELQLLGVISSGKGEVGKTTKEERGSCKPLSADLWRHSILEILRCLL